MVGSCNSCGYENARYTAMILGKSSSEVVVKSGFNKREFKPFTKNRDPKTSGEVAVFCGNDLSNPQGSCIRNALGIAKSLSLIVEIKDSKTDSSFLADNGSVRKITEKVTTIQ